MYIYIAGPYTQGDVGENVQRAIVAGELVSQRGHIPFIPHLNHFWHLLLPHDYEFWLEYDMQWLLKCDAMLRLKGESDGADFEESVAYANHIKVYYDIEEVPDEA